MKRMAIDWEQARLNGWSYCFSIDDDLRFCGRAQCWPGHDEAHPFIDFADFLDLTREDSEWIDGQLAAKCIRQDQRIADLEAEKRTLLDSIADLEQKWESEHEKATTAERERDEATMAIARIDKLHRPTCDEATRSLCRTCLEVWPCSTRKEIDQFDEERAARGEGECRCGDEGDYRVTPCPVHDAARGEGKG